MHYIAFRESRAADVRIPPPRRVRTADFQHVLLESRFVALSRSLTDPSAVEMTSQVHPRKTLARKLDNTRDLWDGPHAGLTQPPSAA